MEERARKCGGGFELEAREGDGTRLVWWAPVDTAEGRGREEGTPA
jgi:hypothetical protein